MGSAKAAKRNSNIFNLGLTLISVTILNIGHVNFPLVKFLRKAEGAAYSFPNDKLLSLCLRN